jgi:hypothetical protein
MSIRWTRPCSKLWPNNGSTRAVLDSATRQQAIALLQKGELPGTGAGLLAIISAIFVYLTM